MGIRRKLKKVSREMRRLRRVIMATQAELTTALNTVNDKLTKIGTETTALLKAIEDLKAQVANAPVTPELQAAVDKVMAQAQVVDDLIPDAPIQP